MPSKELLDELRELGLEAKNHMAVIDDEQAKILTDLFSAHAPQENKGTVPEEQPLKKTTVPEEQPPEIRTVQPVALKEKSIKPTPEKKEPAVVEKPEEQVVTVKQPKETHPSHTNTKKEAENVLYVNVLSLTLRELAELMKIPVNKIIQDSFSKGILLNPNQRLEYDSFTELAKKYGITVKISEEEELVDKKEDDTERQLREYYDTVYRDKKQELQLRPAVVTVMGHVDHGKTTLLDRIRKSRVAEGETGGITQEIGAYQVEYKNQKITFIDTPGHEAFTEMRARGAQATDLVVLVIAADDGVMPQTEEAYNHAKEANVPVIVAINKVDKPNANVELTKQQMVSKLHLVPEDWGGDTVTVSISAKKGEGIDDLLEMILLVSEMANIRCQAKGKARGIIIESRLDPKVGPTATCILKDGVLRVGNYFVAGNTWGKAKALLNDKGKQIREGKPSEAIRIIGFDQVPDAHSILYVVESPNVAKSIVERIHLKEKADQLKRKHISLEEFYKMVKDGEHKVLKILIKADSYGTVEALKNAIARLQTAEITIEIVHSGIGAVSSSDVMLASASDGVILGFKVKVDKKAEFEADKEKVQIKTYDIIFNLIEDVKKALLGMLEPDKVDVIIGHGEVRQAFKIKKVGTIAGVQMLDGFVEKQSRVRIYRNNIEIFSGGLESLKHFQDDVQKVEAPQECGIRFAGFDEVSEKDELEFFQIKEVKRKLEFIQPEN
jgi:translation initiation factor IF-2